VKAKVKRSKGSAPAAWTRGQCLCGGVELEIGVPARWAWHDHSAASRLAHGAAYATYVGCWRTRVRVAKGKALITTFAETTTGRLRSFCSRCGTPLMYERGHAPQMVNVPRALFTGRTGREPLYHIGITEMQDWTYKGERLVPLKGFPGVVWTGPQRRKPRAVEIDLPLRSAEGEPFE
jgi:hypothetical protein